VEKRKVTNNYTFRLSGQTYKIAETSIVPGLKGNSIRVEARLDGTVAARFDSRYLEISGCPVVQRVPTSSINVARKDHNRNGRSAWMKTFSLKRDGVIETASLKPGIPSAGQKQPGGLRVLLPKASAPERSPQ
jgi:hypothetical protein